MKEMQNFDQIVPAANPSTRNPKLQTREHGVSAVELLIVVVVLGVISAVAIPSITRTLELRRLDTAVSILASKLADARMNAIKRNRRAWVLIDPSNRTLQLQTTDDTNTTVNLGPAEALPAGVNFSSPNVAAEVSFDGLGRLPAGTAAWTITLRGVQDTKSKSLSISGIGKVTVANMIGYAG